VHQDDFIPNEICFMRFGRTIRVRFEGAAEQTMATRYSGFTMMEMVAVLAVIAILATLALPSYFGRIVRDQIKSALPLADIAKDPIAKSWQLTQTFPVDNASAGLPPADKIVANYVRQVDVRNGAINVTFGNRANNGIAGKILTFRPAVVEDAPVVPVAWVCGYAETPDKMTINGENLTNVPQELLPVECRALRQN
jgi:type IV pilus assembly protein PilA